MLKNTVSDIFFDLDHTLWDFERNSTLTFKKILSENKIEVALGDFMSLYRPINLEYWKLYRENRIGGSELRFQRLRKTFDALGESVTDEAVSILAKEYIEHLPSFNHLIANSIEVLEYLVSKYRLHIITNGFKEVQEKKLRNSKILHYFEHIVNSEIAGVKKPHPHIFQLALQKADVTATQSLMIGDNLEADIMGARTLGFHTLHFNVHREPEHEMGMTIHDLIEIKNIL